MSTNCSICKRGLTDPKSVSRGIGPVCFNKQTTSDEDNQSPDAMPKLPMDHETMDVVCRRDANGATAFNVPHRIVKHSPTGMEWGYGGSGPSDFALNVLALFAGDDFALIHHQTFKAEFIAALDEEGGTIKGSDIRDWIERQKGLAVIKELPFGTD